MQLIHAPHQRKIGSRDQTRFVVETATADTQRGRLLRQRKPVIAVDQRFALSNPALLSAPSKKLSCRCAPPVGIETVSTKLLPEGSGRYDFGGI
jgi:hypothetical protein